MVPVQRIGWGGDNWPANNNGREIEMVAVTWLLDGKDGTEDGMDGSRGGSKNVRPIG